MALQVGVNFGQISLLAIWAGFGRAPVIIRWPGALAGGAALGIVLGWALDGRASRGRWLVRALLILALLPFLFAALIDWPLITWLGTFLAQTCPGLLFPNAGLVSLG